MTPIRLHYHGTAPSQEELEALVCFVWEADSPKAPKGLPQAASQVLEQALSLEDFTAAKGESTTLFCVGAKPPRLLACGLGKAKECTEERFRRAVGRAAKQLQELHLRQAGLLLPEGAPQALQGALVRLAAEGLLLGAYLFEDYKEAPKKARKKVRLESVHLYDPAKSGQAQELQRGAALGEAVCLARDLGNHPANVMTPERMVEQAEAIARRGGLKLKVLDQEQLESHGMGLLLGVAQGSRNPPRMVVLEYTPKTRPKGVLAFVGKGVTFDSGGISIKPSASMDEMKYDMCGAAAVFGALEAIAALKPAVQVVGVTPLCENLPSGTAVKPGDILTAYSGKRVEVLNTDAEGRLILGDALAYTIRQHQPDAVVDLATLTGACLVALGHYATGAISNHEDFSAQVVAAGKRTGEAIWPLPAFEEYEEALKSKYADLQNIGGRDAGVISGGLFLKAFVEKTPWIHLDIAGTAWGVENIGWMPNSGATGVGVRTLVELATNFQKPKGATS